MAHIKPQDDFERRRAERRRRIRKRRIILFFVFFILMMTVVGVALSLTVFFPIKRIVVSGSDIYTPQQIADACGLKAGDNLFAFSGQKLTETLRSNLPYVAAVAVKRELPDTVHLTVTDAAEHACYLVDGKYYTVGRDGFVLSSGDSPSENVFEIRAKDVKCKVGSMVEYKNQTTGDLILKIAGYLEDNKVKIDYIDVTDPVSISAKVEGRFIVNFGNGNYLERKIAHMAAMIKNMEEGKTGKINLSMWTPDKTQGTFVEENIG